ncbi:t-SNARE domain-containing protein 1-like [Saccostrea echinata]|uniref:t-SNARE domain-containing protein 1-like n=1 Tax=Saccostrea echinata TaxID=191078 RepID=UPI002A814186|nr:t-SNARE domain-containing protein 1-like [Saccostrea echinata]
MDESMNAKKRKPNWSERELDVLAESVLPRNKLLKAKFSNFVTTDKKQELWKEIEDEVNAVSYVNRSVEEIKKKWADIQSLTKKKESERRRLMKETGGGPHSDIHFKSWEKLVLESLSDVAIEGISGGVDTAEPVKDTSTLSQ